MKLARTFTRYASLLGLSLGLALPAYADAPHAQPQAAPAAAVHEANAARPAGPKVVTQEEAAQAIGHGVMMATGSATPVSMLPAMRQAALARPGRTNVYYMSTFAGEENFKKPEVTEKWHPNLFFVSKPNREAATQGRATLHHASLFELAKRIEKDEIPFDTVVVRVSPPDAEGNVSLGTSSDLTMLAVQSVLRRGGKIIAEVNPNVPHTNGNRIPYNSLTHVVHGNELLNEAVQLAPMAAEKNIASNVAKLIPVQQRHTIQIGIGDALAGVGDALKDHPLDIWSEMGPPGLLKLVSMPNSKVGHATFTFLHADNHLYQTASNNPKIMMQPSSVVNDPETIAKQPHMVAINTGLEVDMLGNVNAERDGDRVISFPGGQPDFMKGASMAADGTAIMALRSTAKGNISAIVLGLKGPTTTPKDHVDHVVTEWGATPRLRGQPDGARVKALIGVAHPAFRAELAETAKQRGLLSEQDVAQIKASVLPAISGAPEEIREAAADLALAKGAITNDQHTEIVVDLLTPAILKKR